MPRKQRWHDKTMTVTGSGAGAGTSTVTRSDGYTDATTAAGLSRTSRLGFYPHAALQWLHRPPLVGISELIQQIYD